LLYEKQAKSAHDARRQQEIMYGSLFKKIDDIEEKRAKAAEKARQREIAAAEKAAAAQRKLWDSLNARQSSPFEKLVDDAKRAAAQMNILQSATVKNTKAISSGRVNLNSYRQQLMNMAKDANLSAAEMRKLESTLAMVNKASGRTGASSRNLGSGFAGSTNAAINFNRVIQDAPFGLMGVANNIEPLIFSLRGMDKQSRITAKGFGLLVKNAFTGTNLVLTLATVIPSAILLFQRYGNKAEKAAKQLSVFNDEIERLSKVEGVSRVEQVEKAINDFESSLDDINKKLKPFDDALTALGEGGINISSTGLGVSSGLDDAIQNYETALSRAKELGLTEKQVDVLIRNREKVQNKINELREEYAELEALGLVDTFNKLNAEKEANRIAKERADLYREEVSKQKGLLSNLDLLTNQEDTRLQQLQKQVSLINEIINSDRVKSESMLDALYERREEFSERIAFWQSEIGQKISDELRNQAAINELIRIRSQELDEMVKKYEQLTKGSATSEDIKLDIGGADAGAGAFGLMQAISAGMFDSSIAAFNRQLSAMQSLVNKMDFGSARDEAQSFIDKNQELAQNSLQLNQIIEQGLTSAIGNMANALGSGSNLFDSFLMSIADFAGQLGRFAIGIGLAVDGIRKALKSLNPAVAIAAGAALVALSGAARAALSRRSDSFGSAGSIGTGATTLSQGQFNANLFINGRQVQTEGRFTTARSNQLGF